MEFLNETITIEGDPFEIHATVERVAYMGAWLESWYFDGRSAPGCSGLRSTEWLDRALGRTQPVTVTIAGRDCAVYIVDLTIRLFGRGSVEFKARGAGAVPPDLPWQTFTPGVVLS